MDLTAISLIAGKRIHLRPVRREDASVSVHWRNDPAIRDSVLGYRLPVNLQMEENWTERATNDPSDGRVVLAVDEIGGSLIGYVYLNEIRQEDGVAEVGILIGDRSTHRRGFGTEAMSLLIAYAFESLKLRRLFLRVAAFNEPAIKLYETLGFQREGILREHVFRGGRYHDLIIMGLLREPST